MCGWRPQRYACVVLAALLIYCFAFAAAAAASGTALTTTTSTRTTPREQNFGTTDTTTTRYFSPLVRPQYNHHHHHDKDQLLSIHDIFYGYRTGRFLQIGDFASLNSIIGGTEIQLGNAVVTTRIAGITLTLELNNLRCSNLNVRDITVRHTAVTPTRLALSIAVVGLDADCVVPTYNYRYGFLSGSGAVTAMTDDSNVTAVLVFDQTTVTSPPHASSVGSCQADIVVTNLSFSGGIVAGILNFVEGFVRNTITNQINTFLCDFVTNLDNFTNNLLGTVEELLEPYSPNATRHLNASDPLEAETNLVVADNVSLINFRDPQGQLAVAVDTVLTEASRYLSSSSSSSSTTARQQQQQQQDLNINTVLRDFVLTPTDRALQLDPNAFPALRSSLLNMTLLDFIILNVELDTIDVIGLDTFTRFDPLDEIGNYTLATSFQLESLSVGIGFTLTLTSFADPSSVLVENATLRVGINGLSMEAAVLLAIDEEKLGALQLGSLLSTFDVLPCLIAATHSLNVTKLSGTVESLEAPVVTGFDSPGFARIVTNTIDGAYVLYDEVLIAILPNFINTTLQQVLNDSIMASISNPACPEGAAFVGPQFIDFRDFLSPPAQAVRLGASGTEPYGNVGPLVKQTLDSQLTSLDNQTGLPRINAALIEPLTARQSGIAGTVELDGNLFELSSTIDVGTLAAEFFIGAFDAKLVHLDTVGNASTLLDPVSGQPYNLDNSLILGLSNRPVGGSVRLLVEVNGDFLTMSNDLNISVGLTGMRTSLLAFVQIITTRLMSFPLRDILEPYCWLATMPAPALDAQGVRQEGVAQTFGVQDLDVLIEAVTLDIVCNNCSSPDLLTLPDLLALPEAKDSATRAARVLIDNAITLIEGGFLQVTIDRLLNDAPKRCPHNPFFEQNPSAQRFQSFTTGGDSESFGLILALAVSIVGILVVFVFFRFAIRRYVRKRHAWWLETLRGDKIFRIYRQQCRDRDEQVLLDRTTVSMFKSESVPALVRVLVPLVVVCNIGLFLSGHLNVGGTVKFDAVLAGENIVIDNFFEFSIARSTVDLWNAGGRFLAILILIFSGIWPYTKQLVTLYLWFAPPNRVSVASRGSLFLWLDFLTKWSSVDIFVLMISLVAFRLSIVSPDLRFLPSNFYSIEVFVVPLLGLYSNLTAQVLTQLTSHVIIHYHRKVVSTALQGDEVNTDPSRDAGDKDGDSDDADEEIAVENEDRVVDDGPAERLMDHGYNRAHRGEASPLIVRGYINWVVAATGIVILCFVVAGCILPSFTMELLGMLGVILEFGQEFRQAVINHGVFSIVELFVDQAQALGGAGNLVGMVYISIILVFTVLVAPLAQTAALLWNWYMPMTQRARGKVEVFVESMQSWQYVEVYLIAVILSAWQLGQASELLLNSYCDGLQETFATLAFYGILREEDAQCFKVRATISSGTYLLIVTAFALGFLNTFVTKAVFQYQHDKAAAEEESRLQADGMPDATTLRMMETLDLKETKSKIEPAPVLFTDMFRWLVDSGPTGQLERENVAIEEEPPTSDDKNITVEEELPTSGNKKGSTGVDEDPEPVDVTVTAEDG